MDRNGFICVIFLFLISSDCSSAYSVWNIRKLIGVAPNNNSPATTVSPLPSPVLSSGKESKTNPVDESGGKKSKDPESSIDSRKVNPKGSKSDDSENASTQKEILKLTCEGSTNRCSIQATLTGCIQSVETAGSKDLVLLIQNEGESTVTVNVTIATSLRNAINGHEIQKHQTKVINASGTIDRSASTQIVMKAGKGECTFQMGSPQSKGDFLLGLPSFYKQLTPIYGAYLLFLIALIVGGTWACCKFSRRKRHEGVPYQELEMGLPESASAVKLEAAEGWDEGWDDDWDEDKAVKSPGGRHVASISSTGLTARSTNRDGWEKGWDD